MSEPATMPAPALIEDLALSQRARNALRLAGVRTVGDLLQMSETDLIGLRNMGRKLVDEIKARLVELGLTKPGFLDGTDRSLTAEGLLAVAASAAAPPPESDAPQPPMVPEAQDSVTSPLARKAAEVVREAAELRETARGWPRWRSASGPKSSASVRPWTSTGTTPRAAPVERGEALTPRKRPG